MTTDKENIKQNFLNDLSPKVRAEIQPLHNSVIDEAIENILKGKCKINDRSPQSREEYFIVIAYSLVAGQVAIDGMFDPSIKPYVGEPNRLSLNFRNQDYSFNLADQAN
jgi:hypothetical protein